jgi:hypothetical protein
MRSLVTCLALLVLFAVPADADHAPRHGKGSTTESTSPGAPAPSRSGSTQPPAPSDSTEQPAPTPPAAGGALQVVDANNGIVGQYTFNGCFLRFINGYPVDVCDLQRDGTVVWDLPPQILFLEPGCQGAPFLAAFRDGLSRSSTIAEGMVQFPGDPITTITVRSFLHPEGDQYTCEGAPLYGDDWSIPQVAGPRQTVPLSALGTPPFRLSQ